MIFLVEEVKKSDGFWNLADKKVIGYIRGESAEEAVRKIGAVTTSSGNSARVHVRKWIGNKKGWIITPIEEIKDPSSI